MTYQPVILLFAGSTRQDSYNKKLVKIAANAMNKAGVNFIKVDFRDYPTPIYDGDLEEREGIPENARKFKELLKQCDGFFIASPEYNSSIPPVLKNMIDWASRPEPNEPPLVAFSGKVAAIVSASVGPMGGLRGLVPLRSLLGNIMVLVIPDQKAVPNATTAFNDDDTLKDKAIQAEIERIALKLVEVTRKIKA